MTQLPPYLEPYEWKRKAEQRIDLLESRVTGQPWGAAWGTLDVNGSVTSQTINTTGWSDLIGLAATATCRTNRRYRLRGNIPASGLTATGFVAVIGVWDNSNTFLVQQARQDIRNIGDEWTFHLSYDFVWVNDDDEVTWKLRGNCSVGSTAWRTTAGAFSSAQFAIEDLGPGSS